MKKYYLVDTKTCSCGMTFVSEYSANGHMSHHSRKSTPPPEESTLRYCIDSELNQWGVEANLHPKIYQHLLDGLGELIHERERLARINELEKIEIGGDNIWTVDSGKDMAMLISERIKDLSKQAVKVKAVTK